MDTAGYTDQTLSISELSITKNTMDTKISAFYPKFTSSKLRGCVLRLLYCVILIYNVYLSEKKFVRKNC